jgi:membrane protease YdiL (CAAX protease family)
MAEQELPLPFSLPAGALVLVCPMAAALILVYREEGSNGIKQQFSRCFDYGRIKSKVWYLPILFLMPLLMALEYTVMKLTGMPVPDPQFTFIALPAFFILFFVGGVGEEIGWTGYATDPLQARRTALEASIILGIIWAIWHAIPYIQGHNAPLDFGPVRSRSYAASSHRLDIQQHRKKPVRSDSISCQRQPQRIGFIPHIWFLLRSNHCLFPSGSHGCRCGNPMGAQDPG